MGKKRESPIEKFFKKEEESPQEEISQEESPQEEINKIDNVPKDQTQGTIGEIEFTPTPQEDNIDTTVEEPQNDLERAISEFPLKNISVSGPQKELDPNEVE
jgi:hypothetical protein